MPSVAPVDTWQYDHEHGVYFHPYSSTYAIPDSITGQWSYVPAAEFRIGETSRRPVVKYEEREEGEVEEDVGWGGLMEPEKLQAAIKSKSGPVPGDSREKHPSYAASEPILCATRETVPSEKTPNHILRLVVKKSPLLTPGDVAIIDSREGGVQIGRDRCERGAPSRVRLKEMEVSKTHAVVYWGKGEIEEEPEGWWVVDLGSTHGTFVDDGKEKTRISPPKHSSKPFKVSHLNDLIIGSTILSCHIHAEWPCEVCQFRRDTEIVLDDASQLDIISANGDQEQSSGQSWAMDSKQKRDNREVRRKQEMSLLRETLLNKGAPSAKIKEENPERTYLDRSAMRRRLHPSSPPPTSSRRSASPPTTRSEPISSAPSAPSSFASGLLASQGWTPGSGLGKDGGGRADPVRVEVRTEKRGLGATGAKAVVEEGPGDWKQRGKQRRWEEYSRNG